MGLDITLGTMEGTSTHSTPAQPTPVISGKVAVITGGASGMGRAMAHRFGAAGASVVVADIEEPAIAATIGELESVGVEALGIHTDVSDASSMDELTTAVTDTFGQADLVCLNAGVGAGGPMADLTSADWAWVLGVNLWGVIHGLRVFLPGLEERNDGHLVITASVAGIVSYPMMGPYNASKHAVVSIAETLHHELAAKGSNVGVSVLCPGLVNTRILESDRNRPEQYREPALATEPADDTTRRIITEIYSGALEPATVAEMVHDAVVDKRFYVFTDDVFDDAIARRHREIEQRLNPHLDGHLIETHVRNQQR